MRIKRYLTLSIVASNLLLAVSHSDPLTQDSTKPKIQDFHPISLFLQSPSARAINETITNTQKKDITSTDGANITLENKGMLQGNIKVSGNSLTLTFKGGSVNGSVNSTAKNNTITVNNNGSSINGSVKLDGNNNITLNGSLRVSDGVLANGTTKVVLASSGSNFSGNIQTSGQSFTLDAKGGVLSGNITSDTTSSTLNFTNSGMVSGNISIAGENAIIDAKNNFNINSLNISSTTSTINFNGATYTRGDITIDGNKNTTNFSSGASISGNLTSTATTSTITFKENAYILGNATISGTTSTIDFKNGSQIKGTLSLGASNATVNFSDSTKLATLAQTSGNSTIKFTNSAKITNGAKVTGGKMKIDFDKNTHFNGEFNQIGGETEITFKDSSKFTGDFNQSNHGKSKITFQDKTSMTGDIKVVSGTTDITFTGTSKITGDISAQGMNNKVKFTKDTKLDGNLTLGGSGGSSQGDLEETTITGNITGHVIVNLEMQKTLVQGKLAQEGGSLTAKITDSQIDNGFLGKGNSNNTINIKNSKISNGVEQSTGKLNLTAEGLIIEGELKGTNNSNNTVSMQKGSISGGIKQETGSLHFKSSDTNIRGGFFGDDSENKLQIAGGNFNNGDITQRGGGLNAELIDVTGVRSFLGTGVSSDTGSKNVIHLLNTQISSVTQYGGTLEFNTNADVLGPIKGFGNSQTKITVTGANVHGKITQQTGSMTLTLTNANLLQEGGVLINDAEARFYVNQTTNNGGIELHFAKTSGTFNDFTLKKEFSQKGGTSTLAFASSTFETDAKFDSTESASLIFTGSTIKSIQANSGTTAFNLSDSKMQDFSGTWGDHTISLIDSKAESFTQSGGSLTFNASNGTLNKSVTGQNGSTLAISLNDQSTIKENVSNNGNTTATLQSSEIGGNVTQTGASMNLTMDTSTIKGKYSQTDGITTFNLTAGSKIEQGVTLTGITSGSINLNQNSQIQQGLQAQNSSFDFSLLNGSSIEDGFTQTNGVITGTLNTDAKINGGLTLQDGHTDITLYNNSSINGNLTATNNHTNILLDQSQINGRINVDGGSFKLTGQNKSTIQGDVNGSEGGATINNADFTLILDTGSTFIGDINQTSNKQTIIVKNNSTLKGGVENTDVEASIAVSDNSEITRSIEQTNGKLFFDLSRGGHLGGELFLQNADTILSGTGMDNSIGLGITQLGGTLTGSMHGLTLKGQFVQEGGTSNATFTKSNFQGDVNINSADSSSLTFIQSQLKDVDIRGGENNTLKLLNNTTMTGVLTVSESSKTLLKMQDSKLDGNIDVKINSFLTLDTLDSQITGKIDVNTGGLNGQTDSTIIGKDVILTDTTSDVSFTNKSTIEGDLTATNGNNKINFNSSTIQGDLSQTGGNIELDLSNASTIGKNLNFTNTTAHLTGAPANNKINGNFTSKNTTLTGEISSLTLKGTFTQNKGSSSITFKNKSTFLGEVNITDANPSNLTFSQNSGIKNKINITNGTNTINLIDQSFIKGDTTITNGTTTINASALSSIKGNITATDSTTNLNFDESSLKGNISQTNGFLDLAAKNNSVLNSNITSTNAQTDIFLQNSTLNGNITQNQGDLSAVLEQNAKFNAPGALGEVKVTDANLSIEADNSYWGSNLQHTNNTATDYSATLDFLNDAIYEGTMELNKIKTEANFTHSTLISESIKITQGTFDLLYEEAINGGTIDTLEATNTEVTITTTNKSLSTILALKTSNSTLDIQAKDQARLIGNAFLDANTTATYQASTNGILNLNTKMVDTASTLDVELSGGMLLGTIEKDTDSQVKVTLKQNGEDGGRWAITGDSQVTSLTLNNQDTLLGSEAIFGSSFENPLNLVDFTLNFEDTLESSRVGREMIVRPLVTEDQPLPPEAIDQTYVRQLKVKRLSGNHGFFRIYADLGAGLADNILATQASGDHTIQVIYRADTFREIGDTRIVVAKVEQPNLPVSFKGTQSEVGLTRYNTEIIKENAKDGKGFEWIIGQATEAGMSYASKIIASILQTKYRAFYIEIDGLTQRLGDLEKTKRDQNFWIRGFIGQGDKKATSISTSATDRYFSLWSGFDYNSLGLTGHNFVGGFFNYSGMQTESKDYLGSTSNISLGIYNVFKANSGFYFDLLAKYIFSQSVFDISNYALAKNKPSLNTHNFLANLEMGYTFYLGEKRKSMYLQPLFQATSGWMTESKFDFVDVTGEIIHSKMGATAPAIFKTGLWFGKSFGENIRANLKIGSFFAYDVNSGGKMDFADSKKQASYKTKGDFRMIFSGHGDFAFSDSFRLYTSLDTSFFGSYNTVFNFNLGIRFTFGKRNDVVPYVPMVYNPNYTAPVINDDKRTIPAIQKQTQHDIDKNYIGKPRDRQRYNPESQLAPTAIPSNTNSQGNSRRYSRDKTADFYNPNNTNIEFIDPRKNR